jgi:CBS domain-containing protein
MALFIPTGLQTAAAKIVSGETPDPVTVRALLRWFGAERRGRYVVQMIRDALKEVNLVTVPDFDYVWLDAPIQLRRDTKTIELPLADAIELKDEVAVSVETPQVTFVGGATPDPTHRIGKLEAANRGVVSVGPDDSVQRAITLMMSNGYSQLPVMTSDREVKGIITWESVARQFVLSGPSKHVRDCMNKHREIAADVSLFAAIPEIAQHQYVLVRDKDKRITGIITAADLSLQFQQLAEPFLLLGEIEHQIRRLIENRFTEAELAMAKDPGDTERTIRSVADLTLGECVRLLESDERWRKLGLNIDRVEFIKEAHRIRAIRNDVMHFDPDPMSEDDLLTLRRFTNFVSDLSTFLVAPGISGASEDH